MFFPSIECYEWPHPLLLWKECHSGPGHCSCGKGLALLSFDQIGYLINDIYQISLAPHQSPLCPSSPMLAPTIFSLSEPLSQLPREEEMCLGEWFCDGKKTLAFQRQTDSTCSQSLLPIGPLQKCHLWVNKTIVVLLIPFCSCPLLSMEFQIQWGIIYHSIIISSSQVNFK